MGNAGENRKGMEIRNMREKEEKKRGLRGAKEKG